MDPTLATGASRTVLDALVARVRSASGARIVSVVRGCGGGFPHAPGARSGLDGPMPHTITLVVWGRCRPSPDRVPEGASSDRDASGIVTGGLAGLAGEGLLPVLGAPPGGVGRVDGDDADAEFGGHGDQPGPELAGGHAGDQLAEPLPAAVLLAGLLRGEVQVLDRDGDVAASCPVQQAGEGVPDLGVAVVADPSGRRRSGGGRRSGCRARRGARRRGGRRWCPRRSARAPWPRPAEQSGPGESSRTR